MSDIDAQADIKQEDNSDEDPQAEIDRLRAFGFSDEQIQKMDDYDAGEFLSGDSDRLTIKFNNLATYYWLIKHPLIWSYGNDADGVRLLLGMDYARIQQTLDMEISVSVFTQDIKKTLFARLQQIEIGAKASFDKRLAEYREKK